MIFPRAVTYLLTATNTCFTALNSYSIHLSHNSSVSDLFLDVMESEILLFLINCTGKC